MSLNKFFSTIALVIGLLIGATSATYIFFFSTADQEQAKKRLQLTAQTVASGVSAVVEQAELAMGGMTESAELVGAMKTADPSTLASLEEQLKKNLPGSQKVRLLPRLFSETDFTAEQDIGFADLEMVQSVLQGAKNVRPSVQGANRGQRHLAKVKPVVSNNEVVGVLYVAYSLNRLQQLLSNAVSDGESMLIKQGVLTVAANENQTTEGLTVDGSVAVPETGWNVVYTLASKGLVDRLLGEWFMMVAIGGGSALLAMVLVLVFGRSLTEILRQDQATVIRLVESILEGAGIKGSYPVKLSNSQGTVDRIKTLSRDAAKKGRAIADAPVEQEEVDESIVPSGLLYMKEGINLDDDVAALDGSNIPASVFRAYDIRGVVDETLTRELVYEIGRALGSEAFEAGQQSVVIARDGRLSSPDLSQALAKGLQDTGRDVIDLGMVPTPVLYFATHYLGSNSGVMITGSHNPSNYNGMKMIIDGETLSGERITALRERIIAGDLLSGNGSYETREIVADYISTVSGDIQIGRTMKVVVDCGNGVAGAVVPALYRTLGCEVVELYCDVDGTFPNHHPDPSKPENLQELVKVVRDEQADIGLAFDGDGDRLGVVDAKGNVIWPDRQMMLFAADVLSRQPGADIIFDVKCTRHLGSEIVRHGGRPVMWKTGHSFMKSKIKETGAMLAGEMSGHIFFKERWYGFDDGLYSGARLVEIISADTRGSDEIFAELPDSVNTPELNVHFKQEGENFRFIDKLLGSAKFSDAKVTTIDGLRVDFKEGWGLVRASNTTPSLVIRFEADTEGALQQIQGRFRELMKKVQPEIELPF